MCLILRLYLTRKTERDIWVFRTVHVLRLSGARWTTLDALAWILKGPKVDCCERSNEPTAACKGCNIYWVAERQVAAEVHFSLEGTEGWMKLHNEELIWKEQEVGENCLMSNLFGRNRRLEKITCWGAYLEGTGGWRKLHKEEIFELHFSPNIMRKIKS
jgi:hypothetical protein